MLFSEQGLSGAHLLRWRVPGRDSTVDVLWEETVIETGTEQLREVWCLGRGAIFVGKARGHLKVTSYFIHLAKTY